MKEILLGVALCVFSLGSAMASTKQVLVKIDNEVVTAQDLEVALASSPFGVQANTMPEDKQASLRGLILKRLVGSKLLQLEAAARQLDKTPEFQKELASYREGLLYHAYLDKLRENIKLSPAELKDLREEYKSNVDAYKAAKAAMISKKYRAMRLATIKKLQKKYNVALHTERLKQGIKPETIIISGTGISVPYGDIIDAEKYPSLPEINWLENRIFEHTELVLMAKAARDDKLDVSADIAEYRKSRLPSLMMASLEKKWTSDEKKIKAYYDSRPDMGKVPARWHIGQIVVADEAKAKSLRRKILLGKSLFVLAGQVSIDPYGRSRNGDMGWIMEGKGNPKIEKAIRNLPDGKVSPVIKTAKGYHLVTILERKPGRTRPYSEMRDRVRQELINSKLVDFLQNAQKSHKVVWKVLGQQQKK